jgi:K+-transporting ATPase ATPase A chain
MLVYLLLGEVVFGGLGTGVFSIVIAALVGIFLGGLMVGRTPEYLGKKVTSAETRWIALYFLLTPIVTLLLTAIAVVTTAGRAGLVTNTGRMASLRSCSPTLPAWPTTDRRWRA